MQIYTHREICCGVIVWSKFGPFRCYCLVQVGDIIWSKFFSLVLEWFQANFGTLNYHFVCVLCPIWKFCKKKNVFQERVQKCVFCLEFLCFKLIIEIPFLCFAKNTIKIGVSAIFVFCCRQRRKRAPNIGISEFVVCPKMAVS